MSLDKSNKRIRELLEPHDQSRCLSPSPTSILGPASSNTLPNAPNITKVRHYIETQRAPVPLPANTPNITCTPSNIIISGSSVSTDKRITSSSNLVRPAHATGNQSPNPQLPIISVPVKNEAFQKAIQEYLSEDDRFAFQSATDVMEKLGELQQGKSHLSSLDTTYMHKLQKVQQCVKQFLMSITVCIQHCPEIPSLVMGGLNCILTFALGYIEILESLTDMMECIGDQLTLLSEYSFRGISFRNTEEVGETLVAVFCDLLGFYVKVRHLFTHQEGKLSYTQGLKHFLSVIWEPFEAQFQSIESRFIHHTDAVAFLADNTFDKRCQKIYARCEYSFNKLVQNLETSNDQAAAQRLLNEFGRFRVWAGDVGAHRSARVSLDYRLQEASHIHTELTELMGELNKNLEEALKFIEVGEENYSLHSHVSLGEEFMADLGPLQGQDAELGGFEYLVSDITHIITCLHKFSTSVRNPAPKDHLHKIALIDIPYWEGLDITQVEKDFCPEDSQNSFRVARYLSERLGKANTQRRQLLRSYKAHHEEMLQYIDNSLPSRIVTERNELINAPKPVISTMEGGGGRAPTKPLDFKRASTVYTSANSQTTERTVKVEPSQADEIGQHEDRFSQTSYATSTNHAMRIHVPSPPADNAAFGGEPFECPYCFSIIKIRSRQD